jgi:hypothetical protein
MASIDDADMYGNLTRVAMAKMVANYVLDLGLQELDTTKECTFPDVSEALDAAYDNGVTKACQLGLMGVGIEKFNPNGIVTRAEFGTVLSRAIWGEENNGGDPYYAKHLQALKDEGIMNMIDNPNMKEVRGYVMLMMMRADDNYSPATGCSAEELLACIIADDYDTCIAACSDEDTGSDVTVKSGDLAVTVAKNDGAVAFIGGAAELDYLTFKGSERITLNRVSLERYGFSSYEDVKNIWLENENGEVVTTPKSVNNKDKVDLVIKREFRDAKEATYVVVVDVEPGANAAGTIGFKVVDAESSAKNLVLPKGNANLYSMVKYEGSQIKLAPKGQPRNYYYSEKEAYEVARLQVRAGDAAIDVNGFTLTNKGSLDLDRYLDAVEVTKDGVAMKNVTFSMNKDELRVNFTKDAVESKKTALYVVKVKLSGLDKFGQNVKFEISESADFAAVEAKTNARVTYDTTTVFAVPFSTYTFNGDKINLTNKNLGSVVYGAEGSTDVVFAEGSITLTEPVKLNSFKLVANATGLENVRIVVNGDEYPSQELTANEFTFNNVYLEKSGTIKFVADIKSTAVNGSTITIDGTNGTSNLAFGRSLLKATIAGVGDTIGKYDDYNEWIIDTNLVGTINFAKIKVEAGKGSLTNTNNKDYEVKQSETVNSVVVFEGEYSARRQAVSLNEFAVKKLVGSPALVTGDYITFHLFVDGEEVQSVEMDPSTPTTGATELFDEVEVAEGKTAKIKLVADLYLSNTGKFQFNLELKGQDENGNETGKADEDTRKLDVKSQGSVVVDDNVLHPRKTVVKSDTNVTLASFVIKAGENSSLTDLESFTFEAYTGAGTGTSIATGDLRVKVDGQEETPVFSGTNGLFTVNGLNVSLEDDVVVEIIRKGTTPTAKYTVNLKDVNGSAKNRDYIREVVGAVVSIKSQSSTDDETKFVFAVDKESADQVSNLKLIANGHTLYTSGEVANEVNVYDGMEVEVQNDPQLMRYVTTIEYVVTVGNTTTTVTIDRNEFKDYFRVGNTYAKVARAKD